MAQRIKCSQQVSETDPQLTASTAPCSNKITSTYQQPSMQRHVHPIPMQKNLPPPDQQSALLQALTQQNALMTDLIAAVNGLTALICSRKDR